MKCDIIIPVYKAPEWVKLCVYALFKNTDKDLINKVYLINDCDDELTNNCLKNLKEKYGSKIVLEKNPQNLGFVKTCNHGLSMSTADCVLLLNSDCLLSPNTIKKLINHLKNDSSIGLICPLTSPSRFQKVLTTLKSTKYSNKISVVNVLMLVPSSATV